MNPNAWQQWYSRKEGTVEPEISKLAELLREQRASKILDFGCGTGRSTRFLKQLGFVVTGIDISADMLEVAKKNVHFAAAVVTVGNTDNAAEDL